MLGPPGPGKASQLCFYFLPLTLWSPSTRGPSMAWALHCPRGVCGRPVAVDAVRAKEDAVQAKEDAARPLLPGGNSAQGRGTAGPGEVAKATAQPSVPRDSLQVPGEGTRSTGGS